MALARLKEDEVYRIYLASKKAFANWRKPTTAELNANPTNDPSGLIWNVTCPINTSGSTFDLDDPTTDDSISFCQSAGDTEVIDNSVTVVFECFLSQDRWMDATDLSAPGFNSANLLQSLLRWRGVDYFAILSIGKSADAPFAVGDIIKMAEVSTDWGVNTVGTGETARFTQTFAKRTDINWNYTLES